MPRHFLNQILHGDSLDILKTLPDKSVDLIFADPPYNLQLQSELWRPNETLVDAVNDSWDQFQSFTAYDAFTREWLTECQRVLKDTGTIWVIGSYHNIFRVGAMMMDLGYWLLNDVQWVKPNPMPQFRGMRFTNATETLIWAKKSEAQKKYTFNYWAMKHFNDDKQMPNVWHIPLCTGKERIKLNGKKAHSTQKPEALLYRVILSSSKVHDIVLDPFFGTGTTGAVAKKLRRNFIGIEQDAVYVEVARQRIETIPESEVDASILSTPSKRQLPRVAFSKLIAGGYVLPGQQLYTKDKRYKAIVKADSHLQVGELSGSIHQLAAQLQGKSRSANGWEYWFYEGGNAELVSIDVLRQQYREDHMTPKQLNWAGNITYRASRWHKPTTIEPLQHIVQQAEQMRVVGTRHSFNTIADTEYDAIDLTGWKQITNLDEAKQTVTVEAGVRYGDLALYLNDLGYALHNLASLPHISVVGAIATATHGSGMTNGNLSSAITSIELMTANGDLLTLSAEDDRLAGAVVGLGAIGVVTKVTLKVELAYDMRQIVYLNLPFAEVESHFDAIMSGGYSVSLFTDWQGEAINQVWIKQRVTAEKTDDIPDSFFGAVPAIQAYHPVPDVSPENCTEQQGVVGRWHERLPHFRMDFTPSRGDELQTEYFVLRDKAEEAIGQLRQMGEQMAPYLLTSEIRTIAADDLWMSPCYQHDCVAFHFTWKPDWEGVQALLPEIEKRLIALNVRPHWGKLFTLPHSYMQTQYPKWDDFLTLIQDLDPQGKFRNPFLDKVLYGVDSEL